MYALAQRAVLAFFSVQGAVWLSKIGWPFVQLLDIHLFSHNDDDGDDDYYAEYICSNRCLPCLSMAQSGQWLGHAWNTANGGVLVSCACVQVECMVQSGSPPHWLGSWWMATLPPRLSSGLSPGGEAVKAAGAPEHSHQVTILFDSCRLI